MSAAPTILVGIDEAGYGPRLGPLCVASAALRVEPPAAGPADLWSRLAPTVGRAQDRAGVALRVDDSKALVGTGRRRLERLEQGVLALLALCGREAASDAAYLEALGLTPADLELPSGWPTGRPWHESDGALARTAANAARPALRRAGVSVESLRCAAAGPSRFNDGCRRRGGKAAVNLALVAEHLREALERWGGEDCRVVVDRLGGRTRYGAALAEALPGARVETVSEATAESVYRVEGERGSIEVRFVVGGDGAHLPVAAASMAAKMTREVAMRAFNAYWTARMPEVKPTLGYGSDAGRWIREARRRLPAGGVDRLVRIA